MRMRQSEDANIRFADYEEFGDTIVVADCIGPLIDISKIKEFREIEYARYLSEEEIANKLSMRGANNGLQWKASGVRQVTKEALQHSKLAIRLVDTEMVKQLCRAKTFGTVRIVSTVSDREVFNLAKKVLIDYSNQMVKYDPTAGVGYEALEEGNFEYVASSKGIQLPGIVWYCSESEKSGDSEENAYKIAIDDDSLAYSTLGDEDTHIPAFQEWIGGIREDDHVKRLSGVLDKRQHIKNGVKAIQEMCKDSIIKLGQYTIMNDYYVYDNETRTQLNQRILSIKNVLTKGKAKTKPICVFLAGAPGTGKSYFVECFAKYMKCERQYPVTSLSGVSSAAFYNAIEHHVEQVYNTKRDEKEEASIAFLDEIDTKDDHYAFRFLMDAMTGSRTNENGVAMKAFKSGTVENLVWFFAGSTGTTRQDFMNQLKDDERKVIDFFDRIHFDMKLPSVEQPGQVILTLMSAIKSFWDKGKVPQKISIKVLLAFACTKWTSTRSIMTICRVAAAHPKANDGEITLDLFEGIDTSEEFLKQFKYIKKHVDDTSTIDIEW